MFRASSAHLQEVNDVNCTCMQPLVFSRNMYRNLILRNLYKKLCIKLVSIKEEIARLVGSFLKYPTK